MGRIAALRAIVILWVVEHFAARPSCGCRSVQARWVALYKACRQLAALLRLAGGHRCRFGRWLALGEAWGKVAAPGAAALSQVTASGCRRRALAGGRFNGACSVGA
jgi:hypothetical protein